MFFSAWPGCVCDLFGLWVWLGCVVFGLILSSFCLLGFFLSVFLMESLILAQGERWRRA